MAERWYVNPEVSGLSPSPVNVFFAIFGNFPFNNLDCQELQNEMSSSNSCGNVSEEEITDVVRNLPNKKVQGSIILTVH